MAVELPVGGANGLSEYCAAVVDAAQGLGGVTLVAQSMGGFTAALAAQRMPVVQIVFLNAMIPVSGETPGGWWEATAQSDAMRANDVAAGRNPDTPFDVATYFFHDLAPETMAQIDKHGGADSQALFDSVCDFGRWPDVPIRVLAGRDDRFFPLDFQRRVARERLGVPIEEVDGGHLAALSYPRCVVDALLGA